MQVGEALRELSAYGLEPAERLWPPDGSGRPRQTDPLLSLTWSWVPEEGSYAEAAARGARHFAAIRLFRPFLPTEEIGEKCAICGERTALPDGDRENVREAWTRAQERAVQLADGMEAYFRFGQGRLCLVCATKRFFPLKGVRASQRFKPFDDFQESEAMPYFAIVKMDGDRMGNVLSRSADEIVGGDLEGFHREVSKSLTRFASTLRSPDSSDLNVALLGGVAERLHSPLPQLLYAGGDDVLFVCHPRDALPLAQAVRDHYVGSFQEARRMLVSTSGEPFTLSGAVLFAHRTNTAGLLLHDLEDLLKRMAKEKAGRNALAVRLAKRGGEPVELALSWDEERAPEGGWIRALAEITEQLSQGELSSRQTYSVRDGERTLREVFGQREDRWREWLADRISRNAESEDRAGALAQAMVPFFVHDQTAALRVARFLGREIER